MRRALLLAAILAGLGVQPLAAQAPTKGAATAWLGVATPPDLTAPSILDQIKPKGFAKPAVVPPGEARSSEFNGAAMAKDLATIVEFGLAPRKAGRQMWGRISGYPEETATATWVADQFRAAGLKQ